MTAPALALALVVLGASAAMAATDSFFDKEYEFSTLKTFAFKNLIWRGYDVNTIDMKRPDKRLDRQWTVW